MLASFGRHIHTQQVVVAVKVELLVQGVPARVFRQAVAQVGIRLMAGGGEAVFLVAGEGAGALTRVQNLLKVARWLMSC
ncbi:hypothetical protein EQG89_05715 [Salmonella enterica subsp. enterica]|nr:hypothetical protein [Salmonella enterica subsp. enterica]EDV5312493.1 hypothetical protein [Salmonella enterica subsp. enterica]